MAGPGGQREASGRNTPPSRDSWPGPVRPRPTGKPWMHHYHITVSRLHTNYKLNSHIQSYLTSQASKYRHPGLDSVYFGHARSICQGFISTEPMEERQQAHTSSSSHVLNAIQLSDIQSGSVPSASHQPIIGVLSLDRFVTTFSCR